MRWFDVRTARVLVTVLAFAAVGAFLYGARRTLILFVFSVFFAYLLEPLVGRLQRRRIARHSRGIAILEVYLVMLLALALIGLFAGPKLMDEGRRLTAAIPGYVDKITSGKIVWQLGSQHDWSYQTQQRAEQFLASHRERMLAWARGVGAHFAALAAGLIWLLLVPIFAIFFLKDGRKMTEALIDTVDRRTQRQFLRGVLEDLDEMLAGYIRAQLLLAALSVAVYTTFLLLMRVPYGAALGVAGGIMEFVPVVGPLVAALAIIGVTIMTGYSHVFIVALFLGAWRLMQDYFNSPRIMGGNLEIHPLAALFAILVGGEIAGVIGVYLSIPLMAAVRIVWRRYQRYAQTTLTTTTVITPADTRAKEA